MSVQYHPSTEHFKILELKKNPPIEVSEIHKVGRLPDFETLKLGNAWSCNVRIPRNAREE